MVNDSPVIRVWRSLVTAELWVVRAMLGVVMAIMPLMALAITYDVLARYVFNAPTIWISDASAYALLWVVFLAAPWLARQDGHIRGEFATDRLGPRNQTMLALAISLVSAGVMTVVLWQTASQTWDSYVGNVSMTGSWEIPQFLVWIVMPVGSLFTVIELLRRSWITFVLLRDGTYATAEPSLPIAGVL